MKPYPIAEEILGPVLRVAMPRTVGSGEFMIRYFPPRGSRRIIPVPPRIRALGGSKGCPVPYAPLAADRERTAGEGGVL